MMTEGEGFCYIVQIINPRVYRLGPRVELWRARFGETGNGPAITHYYLHHTDMTDKPGFVQIGEIGGYPVLHYMIPE